MSFLPTVRRVVSETLPNVAYVDAVKGSGPIGLFTYRPAEGMPKLREQLSIQKGLHGADWYRCTLSVRFAGQGKGVDDALHELDLDVPGGSLPDVQFSGVKDLAAKLHDTLLAIDRASKKYFAPPRAAYADLEDLFGHLVEHYATWFAERGSQLAPTDFILSSDDDPENRTCAAFADFRDWCSKHKLVVLTKDRWSVACRSSPAVHPGLWHFWTDLRPEKAEELAEADYRPCAVCGKWIARGTAVARRDRHFGAYADFMCGKCITKKSSARR